MASPGPIKNMDVYRRLKSIEDRLFCLQRDLPTIIMTAIQRYFAMITDEAERELRKQRKHDG